MDPSRSSKRSHQWRINSNFPHHGKFHPVFHASLLSPYSETPSHGPNFSRPPPDLIDGETEYEVELIKATDVMDGLENSNTLSNGKDTPKAITLGKRRSNSCP